ncbi:hypothetical protein NGM37_16855, partial [Streptomyces sp. TRM76130]|nr:hypothetical protein [Streptomyces sp. TRM76130]
PQGRVADVRPPRAAAGQDERAAVAAAPVARGYLVDGLLPRTAAHPELLRADGVLDAVVERLEARGVLRPR